MKIIYLHQYYNSPSMSGSTRSYEMARRLVKLGHQVEIITSTRNQNSVNHKSMVSIESGIVIHWIKVKYSNEMGFLSRMYAFCKFAFLAFIKAIKLRGDLIFASSTPLTISLPGIFAAKITRVPFYFEVRDLWPQVPIAMGILNNSFLRILAYKLEKFSYHNAKGIVALSEEMKRGIVSTGYPSENVTVISNGADLDLFDFKKSAKNTLRRKHGFNEEDIIILYPGTFGLVNNLDYIVDLARTSRGDAKLKFLLIGDGKEKGKIIERSKYLNLFSKSMFFYDPVPKNEMTDFFTMSDMVISTILPIKELEANSANKYFDGLASGTCVVINHGGWQEEELQKYNCGFSLSRDLDKAYSKLKYYLDNRNMLIEMGLNARLLAENRYSRDYLAKNLSEFFVKFK
jgi:glycosyltransferase involved in cell wall biosynthesis